MKVGQKLAEHEKEGKPIPAASEKQAGPWAQMLMDRRASCPAAGVEAEEG